MVKSTNLMALAAAAPQAVCTLDSNFVSDHFTCLAPKSHVLVCSKLAAQKQRCRVGSQITGKSPASQDLHAGVLLGLMLLSRRQG